jgi:hypothetical protein
MIPKCPEEESRKAPARLRRRDRTKTDTGRHDEDSQALERTLAKELGNITPYVRKKGCLLGCHSPGGPQ